MRTLPGGFPGFAVASREHYPSGRAMSYIHRNGAVVIAESL